MQTFIYDCSCGAESIRVFFLWYNLLRVERFGLWRLSMARMTKKLREQIIQRRVGGLCNPFGIGSYLALFAPEQKELVSRVHWDVLEECPEMELIFSHNEHEARYTRTDFKTVAEYVERKSPSKEHSGHMAYYLWCSFFKFLMTWDLKNEHPDTMLSWAEDCVLLREHPDQWEREMRGVAEHYSTGESPYCMMIDFFEEMLEHPSDEDGFFKGCFQALLRLRCYRGLRKGVYILVLYNTGMTENPFTFPDGSKVFATHIDFTDLLQKRITDHAD